MAAPILPAEVADIPLPASVAEKLDAWHGLWYQSAAMHWGFGGLSVLCSAIAAAAGGPIAQGFSAAAAVLTALIGFVHPQRRYFKFVRAWRELDPVAMRYRLGRATIDDLLSAVERGEKMISDFEEKQAADTNPSPPPPPVPGT